MLLWGGTISYPHCVKQRIRSRDRSLGVVQVNMDHLHEWNNKGRKEWTHMLFFFSDPLIQWWTTMPRKPAAQLEMHRQPKKPTKNILVHAHNPTLITGGSWPRICTYTHSSLGSKVTMDFCSSLLFQMRWKSNIPAIKLDLHPLHCSPSSFFIWSFSQDRITVYQTQMKSGPVHIRAASLCS